MNLNWLEEKQKSEEFERKKKQAQKEETEAELKYINADEFTDEAVYDEPDESDGDANGRR